MDAVSCFLWVAVPAAVLAYAAVCDVRSREVPDVCWAVVCIAGSSVYSVCSCDGWEMAVPYLMGSALLTACMLSEHLTGPWALAAFASSAVLMAVPYLTGRSGYEGVAVPVMFSVQYLLYRTGLLRGGADAKCLMSIAIAFPVQPSAGCIPLIWSQASVFPGVSIQVLAIALAMTLPSGLMMIMGNLVRGYRGPGMWQTRRMTLESARDAFVWPVDCSGKRAVVLYDKKRALDEAESSGVGAIRVTPMIPFILPLAVAFAMVAVLGDPLQALASRC